MPAHCLVRPGTHADHHVGLYQGRGERPRCAVPIADQGLAAREIAQSL